MIVLDYQDRRPIYEQVTDKFQILILNGVLPPGSQMPSVRQLATELSVNPNTIQRAYMELEKLGLIYPVKGRGNFVADSSQVQKINRESYRKEFTALIQKGRNTGFNREELEKIIREDKKANLHCHFCGKEYDFTEEELKKLLEDAK